jgi:4-alpha-glucanotransferase
VSKFQLVFLLHAHQPIGNFENVLEDAYRKSYLPFIETVERHPSIRLGLHYTGSLLEWIERAHPDYFERVRELVRRGQVEIIGGGFYEPILIAIPPQDGEEQIHRLADYIEKHFGRRPGGAWLAERVWEPQLPSTLSAAGVEYTLVDDNHFLGSGFELAQLYGYYLAEDQGQSVKVIPGLKVLRYLIPFRDVRETTDFLRKTAGQHPGGFAAMGDDLEKFGVWPGTYEHCYQHGWIERLFSALEGNADWLETSPPGSALASRLPLGRADLPTASYTEMMEWALPTPARVRYHALTEGFASRPEDLPFVRGGIWRNFFSKYSESNLLQKKMLHVSGKVRRLARSKRKGDRFAQAVAEATTLLLRGQCNDPYWHGVFGGLYAPHLRTACWRALIDAERIADEQAHNGRDYSDAAKIDFDTDGCDEIYFTSEQYAVLVQPRDGGTISAIDFRGSGAALINSLKRRPESYHAKIRGGRDAYPAGVQSIHEQTRMKEVGLERWLNYDRWTQNSFRLLVFGRDKNYEDCAMVRLGEDEAVAAGLYRAADVTPTRVSLFSESSPDWQVAKMFSLRRTESGFEIVCDVSLKRTAQGTAAIHIGVEAVVNFLAPSAPDRYFESAGQRFPLRWSAAVAASGLRVVDEWQKVSVTIAAPAAHQFWIAPIETVSESEDGFERIYQGSKILGVWPAELAPGGVWKGQLVLQVARLGS